MRRYVPILVAGSALIAAACSESVAPTRSTPEPATLSFVGNRSFAAVTAASDPNEQSIKFTLRAAGGVLKLGAFSLNYDANAVCDPATSGYGPDTWKQSCTTLTTGIEITARWGIDGSGKAYVHFSPDVRFSPDKNVTLAVARPEIAGKAYSQEMYNKYNIWYVTQHDGTSWFIDEAYWDQELITHFDTQAGIVWRKIRHFSFWIHSGGCNPDEDPSCAPM